MVNIINGTMAGDPMTAGDDDDIIYGGAGSDSINGGEGNDVLHGGEGDDSLSDTLTGNNTLDGGAGEDVASLSGELTVDTVLTVTDSSVFADSLGTTTSFSNIEYITISAYSDAGVDITIDASAATLDVVLFALPDTSTSMSGMFTLIGGSGDDLLSTIVSDTVMTGGTGYDHFNFILSWSTFSGPPIVPENVEITDFSAGDVIHFEANLFTLDGSFMPVFIPIEFIGTSAFSGAAGEVRYETAGGQTLVHFDADGDAASDGTITLSNGEFTLASVSDETMGLELVIAPAGSPGDGVITGTVGINWLQGMDVDNVISGGDNDDLLDGGGGNDILNGDAGNDSLSDDLQGDNVFNGGGGTDTVSIQDTLTADEIVTITDSSVVATKLATTATLSSVENLHAFLQTDGFDLTLDGSAATLSQTLQVFDTVGGSVATILGGSDADVIELYGAAGSSLTGGDGADTFSISVHEIDSGFSFAGTEITDFSTSDVLSLPSALIEILPDFSAEIVALSFIGTASFTGQVGEVRYETTGGETRILIDGDGDGASDGAITLSNGEFVLETVSDDLENLLLKIGSGTSETGGASDDELTGGDGNDVLDGGAGNDTLLGGAGDDFLVGGAGNDIINGQAGSDTASYIDAGAAVRVSLRISPQDTMGAGFDRLVSIENLIGSAFNDNLFGSNGANRMEGGDGQDSIYTYGGDDTLIGGTGVDLLSGGGGNDLILGEGGGDSIYGGRGDDTINGGTGDDYIEGGAGSDFIEAGLGNDSVYGGGGGDFLFGGNYIDNLFGQGGDDFISGGGGNDLIRGGGRDDTLNGDLGDDTLFGEAGNDILNGGDGNDLLSGAEGADTLFGGTGADELNGGVAIDLLNGGTGNDLLSGGGGNDLLYGEGGQDQLFGDEGNDTLDGGAGFDKLNGGAGLDVLTGGADKDWFIMSGANFDNDRITDFEDGTDRIVFRASTGVTSMADFNDVRQAGSDVVIETDAGNVRIENMDVVDVDVSDFIFS